MWTSLEWRFHENQINETQAGTRAKVQAVWDMLEYYRCLRSGMMLRFCRSFVLNLAEARVRRVVASCCQSLFVTAFHGKILASGLKLNKDLL